ncbi:bifunctional DNA primase/polymerase [Actinocatenispora sera]|uniref:DNA primase n=3 Tax=Actinocatenispora sera TaxID=390989 RepID=A0A810KYU8_9ACTN|nr:bifunctional DNA primase/polymerase [Actinocatenispora sera]BCJ28284.1 DNA primase [Actinocatenispora sera]
MTHPTSRYHRPARAAAGRGWPVFVLGRTKRPVANCPQCHDAGPGHDREACGCLTCHGFYAATTDPHRIAAMLSAVPAGLLAIRTGAAAGLVVVDIDPQHGGQLDRSVMVPTYTVATGSGGWHLYYAHPGHPVTSRPMPDRPGVDIKADGGYVVAPPSVHPVTRRPYRTVHDGPVVEMPPRLAAIVDRPTAPAPPQPAHRPTTPIVPHVGGGGISSPAALLASNLRRITTAPVGRRRTTLYGVARGVARIVAAGALDTGTAVAELTDAGRAAEQTDRDIRAAITGGFRDENVPLPADTIGGAA